MAEQSAVPAGAGSTPAAAPTVLPWLLAYTAARLAIAAALIALLWVLGLPGIPGFLFGVLLAMPVSYLVLRRVRDRLTRALVARQEAKERLRARLRGSDADDAA